MKNHCRLRDHAHFFHFLVFDSKPGSCQPFCGIIIANKSFNSAKAALVCSLRASGRNCPHLGCCNVMRSRGYAVQNKGITLKSYHIQLEPVCQVLPFDWFTTDHLVSGEATLHQLMNLWVTLFSVWWTIFPPIATQSCAALCCCRLALGWLVGNEYLLFFS